MNSQDIFQKLEEHFLAGSPAIYIHSAEEARVDQLLVRLQERLGLRCIHEWNLGHGWVDFDNKQPLSDPDGGKTELEHALLKLLDADLERSLVLIKGARLALEHNSLATARLKQLLNRIERHHAGECSVVLVAEAVCIPAPIEAQVTLLSLPLPDREEIDGLLAQAEHTGQLDVPAELRERTVAGLRGLTASEIGQLLKMVGQRSPLLDEPALQGIRREKEQIIAKSGVLEMVDTAGLEPGHIGGLENLKRWLEQRATIVHRLEEAQQHGVKPPKGVLIAGMPGCGKSLTAKVAASLFQQPLLRLDIGSLLGKYVGESEHNMRRALSMAETVSPCVLWVDELEKAFVGMGGGNASEVTARLLGYFLTWMQEKTGAVFVIATANDISVLPPELLRKGRFDEIFYVGFPNAVERRAILDIHLRRVPEDARQELDEQQMARLVELCRDYSGADIENAVNEACANAFIEGGDLNQEQLAAAIQSTIPLRETLREQVGRYEELFERLKLRPASEYQGLSVAQMIKMAGDPNQVKREEVAANPDCPDDLLEKLARDPQRNVVKAVYSNPSCPERLLSIRLSIAKGSPQYDAELLELACLHGNAPEDLLVHQIDEGNIDKALRRKLAKRTQRGQLQEKLATDDEVEVRRLLASNLGLEPEVQLSLTNDADIELRQTLACNPAVVGQALERLVEDSQFGVRFHLSSRTDLPIPILARLAEDRHSNVRRAVAGNPTLPEALQLKLASDSDDSVVATLLKSPSLSPEVKLATLASAPKSIKLALANSSELTEAEQLLLLANVTAGDGNDLKMVLALHPKLAEELQIQLASDPARRVRCQLAKHPQLGKRAQEVLANDDDRSVLIALSENPSLYSGVKDKLKHRLKRHLTIEEKLSTRDVLRTSILGNSFK